MSNDVLYPLSSTQQAVWLDQLLAPDLPCYNIGTVVQVDGLHDVDRFEAAVRHVAETNEALRIVLEQDQAGCMQRFATDGRPSLQRFDFSLHNNPQEQAWSHIRKIFDTPFELYGGRLWTMQWLQAGPDRAYWLLCFHHLVADGMSISLVGNAVVEAYSRLRRGEPLAAGGAAASYSDFLAKDSEYLSSLRFAKDREFWLGRFASLPEPLFEGASGRRGRSDRRFGQVVWPLERQAFSRLNRAAAAQGGSSTHFLLAALAAYFSRFFNRRDEVVIGMPVHNRTGPLQRRTVGMFSAAIPVGVAVDHQQPFASLLQVVAAELKRCYRHQRFPLAEIHRHLLAGASDRRGLFDISLSIEGFQGDLAFEDEVHTAVFPLHNGYERQPLAIYVRDYEQDKPVHIEFNFDPDVLAPEDVRNHVKRIERLVLAAIDTPGMKVADLPLLDDVERNRLLHAFNQSQLASAGNTLIHELFEQQVLRDPDATAVEYDGRRLSYQELNQSANQLAHHLRGLGLRPDDLVAICMERGLEMVVAILATLKAGAAYVPLDPVYPPERLAHMLQDSAPLALLTQASLAGRIEAPRDCVRLVVDAVPWAQSAWANASTGNPDTSLDASHLAYVIYTSGSTGTPKGVMVEHGNVTRLFTATRDCFHFDHNDVWTLFHSFSFDFSVWELWGALLHGGKLVIVSQAASRSPQEFHQLVCKQGVTVLNQTPSAFRQFIAADQDGGAKHKLRYVIFGGEALETAILKPWYASARNHATRLVNMYGITETTVHVTCRVLVPADAERSGPSPIGMRIPDLSLYVLDPQGRPAPLGMTGEIYVGGAGVARGYLRRPELTAERFLQDPFSATAGTRMYRSGDLGRYLHDGSLEYLGRNDSQVKIRGFRIELGEIEAQLARMAGVREAVVVAREDQPGDKRLVAYLVAQADILPPEPAVLRAQLRAQLPEYMVPAAYVSLASLPLTPNGKLDRKALPAPEGDAFIQRAYEAPQGGSEQALAQIWSELLGVDSVGRHDHFFELGGHSILAVQLLERMHGKGFFSDIRSFFAEPTLAALAATVVSARQAESQLEAPPNGIPQDCSAITPEMLPLVQLSAGQISLIADVVSGGMGNIQDIYPLAPLQEGILFHHMLQTDGDAYVLPALLRFDSKDRLDRFTDALNAVIARHDILRTAVLWEGLDQPLQVVWRHAALSVQVLALEAEQGEIQSQLQQHADARRFRLDVRSAPMLRGFAACDAPGQRWLLQLLHHHLTLDHTTTELILQEVIMVLQNRQADLPAPVPFRNFVAQARLGVSEAEHEDFFREMLADVDEPTAPFGLLDVQGDGTQVAQARLVLPSELAARLRRQAKIRGLSAASLFHLAWAQVLARCTGRDDVVFGTVLFGRMQGGAGADRAMGMFINTLPLRVKLGELGVGEGLQQVHAALTGLLHHEHASLALAQRCSGLPANTPLFSALLNYRHSQAQGLERMEIAEGMEYLGGRDLTSYPFSLYVDDLGAGFVLTAEIHNSVSAQRIALFMQQTLEELAFALEQAPQTPLHVIGAMPAAERELVLHGFNNTRHTYSLPALVHEGFEQQAAAHPERIALELDGEQLTYRALNAQANRLARHLRGLGVGPDTRVAICAERSLAMVVAIVATLKAGGAYVPLDTSYPDERLAQMLQDSEPVVVLAQKSLLDRINATAIALDEEDPAWANASVANLHPDELGLQPGHLAYVIYTSGSTGTPKGVAMPHHALVNLLGWQRSVLPEPARTLQFAALGFDVAFQEIFSTLTSGGTLVLLHEALRQDLPALADWLGAESIERMFLPYIALNNLSELWSQRAEPLPMLQDLITAGEQLRITPAIRRMFARHGQARLHNHYGPTESHVVSAHVLEGPAEAWEDLPPIGRPIGNSRIYLLDAHRQPVPLGLAGEIYIGGVQVARGYLQQPELTAERFIDNPFVAGERLYKTGDLGRWREDGAIEYLGRNDFQVKIRGFRIELGEIEAQLSRIEGVRETVVIAREDSPGDKRLVAYLVTEPGTSHPDPAELREQLKAQLPEYMVPAAYVMLASLPLTPNGKLDRKALPAPEGDAFIQRAYEAPQGEIEQALAQIWSELLGVERIGRHDHFFELGGHSLLAIRLVEQLRRRDWFIDIRSLFAQPQLSALATAIRRAASLGKREVVPPANAIPPGATAIRPAMLPLAALNETHIARIVQATPGGAANIQDIYPLAPLQEGILFHHLLQIEGDAYVLPTLLGFDSKDRLDRFTDALNAVIARHDILRTAVLWEGLDQPLQVVWRHAALSVQVLALEVEQGEIQSQLQQHADARRFRLDVRSAPMLQGFATCDAPGQRWLLQLRYHHLVMDHTTLELLLQEVALIQQGRQAELPAPVPFRNFVAQARLGVSEAEHEVFFRQMLADVDEPTAPFGLLDVQGDGSRITETRLILPFELALRLRKQVKTRGLSAASLFHLAWAQVLARCAGRDDVVFGTVLFGRMQGGAGADRAVGLFINTLPLRVKLGELGVEEGLQQVHAALTGLLHHEHASLALAQRCSGLPANTPLFSALLNYRHSHVSSTGEMEILEGVRFLGVRDRTNYPFGLYVDDSGRDFELTVQVDESVSAQRIALFMQQTLEELAFALEQAPQTPLHAIGAMPAAERELVLHGFNNTRHTYNLPALVHEGFEQQAAAHPERIALELDGEQLTYRALNEQANRLARHLRGLGVGPDTRVAICAERSLAMVVAIVATLKAGGAYVPLDPSYPDERLAQMLQDSEPVVVLAQKSLLDRINATAIALDEEDPAWANASVANLHPDELGLQPGHLAYVIYTSGSTGMPKGVAMPHHALVNLLGWQRSVLPEPARTLQFAALGFDVAFQEIFSTLTSGGTLVLLHEALRQDLPALADWLGAESIERMFLPYIALNNLSELWSQRVEPLPMLQDLITAGEQLRITPAIRRMFARHGQARLHNHYGPTESHVVSAHILEGPAEAWEDLPPIGRPIGNSRIYLLDAHRQPVPLGLAGEIYIGGVQVARGYLQQPELTAERFIDNSFVAGERLYKTGDLGLWREDGSIEYLGRNDFQVKIRGFRIELGEIEAQLSRIEGIRETVVIAREDSPGDKRLVAYLVAEPGVSPLDPAELREQLKAQLPEYMVPAAYVMLASLPLTPNGKLDRKALPAPEGDAFIQRAYEAPQGEIEQALAQIWSELLGVERIGRHDHFFELGGHSLLAIRLISQLRQRLDIELPLAVLFAHPQLAELALEVAEAGQNTLSDIMPADRSGPLPLSCAQQRLWFIAGVDSQASAAYHIPGALRLRGVLDQPALKAALDRIIERHEALRTCFVSTDGQPSQLITPARGFLLAQQDAEGLAPHALENLCKQAAAEPFDLAAGPLIRGRLLRLGADDHVLLVVMHHIISDGWSLSLLMHELSALYSAMRDGQPDPLPPLAIQYADYAAWQRRWLQGPLLQQQLGALAEQLRGAPELVSLPTDRPRPALQDYHGASIEVALDAGLSQALKELGRRHGATLYMTVLAAWAALVARLSGQPQVVLGSSHAGRSRAEAESLIGFFINTQALKFDLDQAPTVKELLAQARKTALRAQQFQDVPFEQIVEVLNPVRSMAHHPLFQLMLTWHNTPQVKLALADLSVERVESLPGSAQFDLALDLEEVGGHIAGKLNYATALFDPATVRRHWDYLQAILRGMVADDEQAVGGIALLGEAERRRLLHDFNNSDLNDSTNTLVHALFEQQAARHPEAVALEHEGRKLSYGALNRRANQLAHYLRQLGVRPDDRVALCLERGIDMVVAVIATLKAGAAYVPLDPVHPRQRLAQMLEDSAPAALLTQASLRGRLPPGTPTVAIDETPWEHSPWAACPMHNPDPAEIALNPAHLAYVIYTSGSTGVPKGVMVEHRQLSHQAAALNSLYAFQPDDRVLQFSALSFDVAAEEIFGALLHGATLVLRSDAWITDPQRWCQLCADHRLTVANLPTLFWQRLAQETDVAIPPQLRQIVIGGDAASAAAIAAWWLREGHRPALNNAYGPTETTINATVARCGPLDGVASIGRPLPGVRIYLLDAHGQPVPIGVAGEICIGGAGVARGYLHRPQLTNERFVRDPFAGKPAARMYKSGDLGRWRADGTIEFLGRTDFQVKIRGFRIELGEIEAQLSRIAGIREAVVIAREDRPGEQRLVAYLVAATGASRPDPAQLRALLSAQLPDYMLPAAYVPLEMLPLAPNGKLDRRALPAPEGDAFIRRVYEEPLGEIEQILAQIWSGLLGVESVGRQDSFFELGGHSLLAVRMISQLRQRLEIELPLAALFAHPQLAELARDVAAAGRSTLSAITATDRSRPMPLSHAQQRLWYVTQIDAQAGPAYHIPGALRLRGALDRKALQAAMDRIVERHEILRTRFVSVDGQPCQVIDAPSGFALSQRDFSGAGPDELKRIYRQEAVEPFDLARGPLIRGRLLRLGDDDHVLLLTMHHIISDGWSLSVLAREFSALYRAMRHGAADPLPPLAIQYADYAAWQRQWLQGPLLQQQLQYWTGQLHGAPGLISLPTDRPRPDIQDYRGASIDVALDEELSRGLKVLARRHGVTLYMTVLAAWAAVLGRLSGQAQVVIGSSVAGRYRTELEPLIGFFVNAQALSFKLDRQSDVRQLLAQARQVSLQAQNHRDVPFEQVVEAINPVRSMAYNPIYQVRLAWQNTPETRLELEGLSFESVGSGAGSAQFDLSLDLEQAGDRIVGQFNYASALFDQATVQRHWGYLQAMLRAMAADDSQPVERIALLDAAERSQLLETFNDKQRAYPAGALVHGLFEQQAAEHPDAIALVYEDGKLSGQLSYGELNQRANQLAHHLRSLGVRPDDRVALCLERSLDLAVALIATLKAGGAYVPLDPIHPDQRLAHMLEDSAPVVLLTQARLHDRLRLPQGCTALLLDGTAWQQSPWAAAPTHNPDPGAAGLDASHLAYVIYTSGSTGTPKGVMVEHRNVLTFLRGLEERIHGLQPDCRRIAWNSSFGFDMAVKAWGQLTMGRTVFLVPENTRLSADAMLGFIEKHAIDAMECTPSQLRMMLGAGFPQERGHTLRKLLLGGEAIDAATWRTLGREETVSFFNMYGPTECSVDAACGAVAGDIPQIGSVMPNARIYLLDPYRQPVPLGVTGEIYIGGAGVARGYLHRPQLTAERFLDDPFAATAAARMYKTGDLGRWRQDGTIEYLGRNDFQVKIRGFRIELGEIEARLMLLPGVREAAVTAREDSPGGQRLVAYVVPDSAMAAPAPGELRAQLSEQLPDYMLPAAYVSLAALPLTANGKLDRQALPAPDGQGLAQQGYEAPAGPTEQALATIWGQLLGVERVGRHDNFFELGGHSALAIQLIHNMSEKQLQVDVQMIFNAPTLAHLASATIQLEEIVL
ncbi:D-alanine--poly(phosphoribitol) ligase, subunit 1 [Collimonas fungivorans]|uniref:D-alanine--poly(Phosphoribitol) ligase, subunit 1 n=1 Tax=Collimonas fungivorans TaxID=158899 RepID=A0A127PC56_9BURK|nr:non-ribosomal peptide synthetase [Collimonas fungivorans]AMO95406.1 D-alanine--poly(phosphoribitol) ligase, subunit 1 [Collimonas fungivorans]